MNYDKMSDCLVENVNLSYSVKESIPPHPNMLIQGDNLKVLSHLETIYTGKVRCVYIDPPYNTGQNFDHYSDKWGTSASWSDFIRCRIKILWNLLTPDGSIWVSIDDREMAYLRILLDEVCGRDHFIACNVWQKKYSTDSRSAIGDCHEYILVYAKNPNLFRDTRNKLKLTDKQSKVFKNPNSDPKGRWRSTNMTAQSGHGTRDQFYEIVGPNGHVFTPLPVDAGWSSVRHMIDGMKRAESISGRRERRSPL